MSAQPSPLIIAHAAPSSDACQEALPLLRLPHLEHLLPLLHHTPCPRLPALCHNSPAEHLLAQAWGWNSAFTADGLLPFAAHVAQQRGLPTPAGQGWAFITPCHWDIQTSHLTMAAPELLQLSDDEGEALRQAMLPYFVEDGLSLHALPRSDASAPLQWLACGAALHQLPTASLAVAVGNTIDDYLPRQPQTRSLRRLQNEMQMLLYSHPVNDTRAMQQHRVVNSFWISGTGEWPASSGAPIDVSPTSPPVALHTALQNASQQHDPRAWHDAWLGLDAELIAPLVERCRAGQAVDLYLCGPHKALHLHRTAGESGPHQPLAQRLLRSLPWHTPQPQAVALLQSLL
ncbi:hypothetical protein KIK84_15260 [Curvibacter sp. CHRR-16]|uniref:hypothetical protein n=1 Tax=Curvibacter sp. CHRR-16 TaxID=2835872 RepID=UPI001BD9FF29|nr:hypothetical protein [Curvibacter sp. CHRR-16]MBT0571683.1 hypothetical protein [Curvibacter sp. CHRR-16]